MSITLLTHYLPTDRENYQQLADMTIPNRDKYCAKNGYKHLIHSGPYLYPDMYYAYQRLYLLRDFMIRDLDTEYFWVLNVQAVITNINKKIEEFVDDEHSFWITRDVNGLNAGSFIIRNSKEGLEYLDFIISLEERYRNDCWHEQRAMQHNENHDKYGKYVKVLNHPSINSYRYSLYSLPDSTPGTWTKGDLVLSLPGLNLQQRLDLVKGILNDGSVIE